MLHKDATYKTYKSFLEHTATKIDEETEAVELCISVNMQLGTDDEKALAKASDHDFCSSKHYLCCKHNKDNAKQCWY